MTCLTPEYRNAMNVIDSAISLNLVKSSYDIPNEIMNQGSILQITRDFKSRNIPAGKTWRWNQVKSRYKVLLPKSKGIVEFYKLMPRTFRKDAPKPNQPYKIWRFDVFDSSNGTNVTHRILWCEKGLKDTETVLLEDLKFLSHFMEPSVAREIWPVE